MGKWLAVAGLFSIVLLAEAGWFRSHNSIVVDETFYLSCSMQTLHDHRLDSRLAKSGVAPLPIILNYLLPLHGQSEPRAQPWIGRPQDANRIYGPRLASSLLIGVPLIFIVAGWLYRRKGLWAASAGAALITLSPTIITHISLATTDGCLALFVIATLAVISLYFQRPSRLKILWVSVLIGAAIASKYSGIVLLPTFALLLVLSRFSDKRVEKHFWSKQVAILMLVGILSFLFCWAFHGFEFIPIRQITKVGSPDESFATELFGETNLAQKVNQFRVASPLAGMAFQYLHNLEGHSAFLLGQHSDQGWWYYLPYVFGFKSTPAELLLTAFLLLLLLGGFRRPLKAFLAQDPFVQTLFVGSILFTLSMMLSHVDTGQRYLLPLYPLIVVLGIDRIWNLLGERRRVEVSLVVALIAVQAWSSLSIAPLYLSYFNWFSGGAENGWRLLVDSNVDWGQDLPALRDKLNSLPNKHLAIAYFGSASPIGYGIEAGSILENPQDDGYDTLAISATYLQGVYLKSQNPFQKFLSMAPLARAGFSLFLFDLSTPGGKKAFAYAVERIQAVARADPQLAASKTDVDLYQFTMTLMSVQDYPDKDVFEVCYAQLFRDRRAAPAKLAFIQSKLDSISGSGYKYDFKLGLLHAAKLILLPGAARAGQQSASSHQDFEQFRSEYNLAVNSLARAAEVGPPVADVLRKTGKRIDSNGDGFLSDQEIGAFLFKKGLSFGKD
jgi:Dolichyl-phosphate-mannose-protein mannosyltransferase